MAQWYLFKAFPQKTYHFRWKLGVYTASIASVYSCHGDVHLATPQCCVPLAVGLA